MGAERGQFHGAGNHQARSVRRGPSAAERKGAEALVALRQGAQVTVGSLSRSRGVLTISCNFGPIQVGSISLSSSVLLNLRPSWLYNQQPKRVTVIPPPGWLAAVARAQVQGDDGPRPRNIPQLEPLRIRPSRISLVLTLDSASQAVNRKRGQHEPRDAKRSKHPTRHCPSRRKGRSLKSKKQWVSPDLDFAA